MESAKIGDRDAIHVPVVWVTTDQSWVGPYRVKFTDSSFTKVRMTDDDDCHGISNPWLDMVNSGDKFEVWLKPGSVTKLRHGFDIDFNIEEKEEYDECSGCYGASPYDYNDDEYEDNSCRGCY